MWRMWDEQIWFVATTVMVVVAWVIRDRLTYGGKTSGPYWPWVVVAVSAAVLGIFRYIVICYQQRHWEPLNRRMDGEWALADWAPGPHFQELVPDAGLFLTIALGVLFGVAFGAALSTMLRGRPSAQSLWGGALALLAVSIGYSLPVYHREIAGLLRDSGLSSLKISVADIAIEAALASKGTRGEVSASGGATGSPAQSVTRLTDPTPGVQALYWDMIGNVKAESRSQKSIVERDKLYVHALRGNTTELSTIQETGASMEKLLAPVRLLAKCLDEYKENIQDSQLLLIDISSSISSLFRMHRHYTKNIIELTRHDRSSKSEAFGREYTNREYTDFLGNIIATIASADRTQGSVNHRGAGRQCELAKDYLELDMALIRDAQEPRRPSELGDSVTIYQPYLTIALAWLLQAHGAADEAASVLAEWLESWEQLDRFNRDHGGKPEVSLPEWYRIDVLARLQTILKVVAGNNNRAFHAILSHYRNVLADYLGSAVPSIQLDQIGTRCAEWKKATGLKSAVLTASVTSAAIGSAVASATASTVAVTLTATPTSATATGTAAPTSTMSSAASPAAVLTVAAAPVTKPNGADAITEPQDAADDLDARRGLAFVLWGTEVDLLRTELDFIPEIDSFESVEALRRRANLTRQMTPECLPQPAKSAPPEGWSDEFRTFGPTYNAALVADSMITAGLVSLAAGDRMSALGRSPPDRERADKARKVGEDWLIAGWADLEPIWRRQSIVRRADTTSWPDRIFGGTEWDKTASLALRVLSRLHQGE